MPTDKAERLDYDIEPQRLRAARAWLIFSALFVVVGVGTGLWISERVGYGGGFWNGHTTYSCYTPGGPYYLPDVPQSEQKCPSDVSSAVKGRATR